MKNLRWDITYIAGWTIGPFILLYLVALYFGRTTYIRLKTMPGKIFESVGGAVLDVVVALTEEPNNKSDPEEFICDAFHRKDHHMRRSPFGIHFFCAKCERYWRIELN
jgi:hypothetical protein